jgi:GNAT superfamily N-acetyltransferase
METPVIIRRARPEDATAIRRMVFGVLCEYGIPADPDGSDADVMDFGAPHRQGVIHLTAETGGEPVGSAILTPYGTSRVKLSKLFLRRDQRGRGLGRKLLAAAIAQARLAGYAEIFLTTRGVYHQAVNLYESSGWLRGPDQSPPGPDRLYYLPLHHAGAAGGTSRGAAQPMTVLAPLAAPTTGRRPSP